MNKLLGYKLPEKIVCKVRVNDVKSNRIKDNDIRRTKLKISCLHRANDITLVCLNERVQGYLGTSLFNRD